MRALALLAAFAGAALLPRGPLGVGVPLVAMLVIATVASAGRVTWRTAPYLGLATALTMSSAFLDAVWVVRIDLAAAWILATIAVAGLHLEALLSPFRALVRIPQLAPTMGRGSAGAVRGVLAGCVLVLPFGALFWSADAAFAALGGGVPMPPSDTLPARVLVFAVVFGAAVGLSLAARASRRERGFHPTPKLATSLEWALPLLLLDLLFLVFVLIQATVLFGGREHVLRTTGLTYAEYARQGFWQLLAAAVLTLGVGLFVDRVVPVTTHRNDVLRRVLLGVLNALTIVTVASAIHRLHLYDDAFGLTRPRLLAETVAWGLGAVLALVLAARAVTSLDRVVPRLLVIGCGVGLLALSLSNPDRRIAERNLERLHERGLIDLVYANHLSADAVPVLARLPAPLRDVALATQRTRLTDDDPWSSLESESRARAGGALLATGRSGARQVRRSMMRTLARRRPAWTTWRGAFVIRSRLTGVLRRQAGEAVAGWGAPVAGARVAPSGGSRAG